MPPKNPLRCAQYFGGSLGPVAVLEEIGVGPQRLAEVIGAGTPLTHEENDAIRASFQALNFVTRARLRFIREKRAANPTTPTEDYS